MKEVGSDIEDISYPVHVACDIMCQSSGIELNITAFGSTHTIVSLVTTAEGLLEPSFELLRVNVATVIVTIYDSALGPWEVADIAGPDDLLSIHGADRHIQTGR